MNSSKLLQQVISVILVTVFLVGCGAPTAMPTLPPPPPTFQPPPPTFPLPPTPAQPVPPTAQAGSCPASDTSPLGILKSTDHGVTWTSLGNACIPGTKTIFAVDPTPLVIDGRIALFFVNLNDLLPGILYRANSEDGVNFDTPLAVFAHGAPMVDPFVLRTADSSFRIYVTAQIPGEADGIISAWSKDGLTFAGENGVRSRMGGMPGALLLPDGRVRLFLSGFGIGSFISSDGLNFFQEPGSRIPNTENYITDDPEPIRLSDGTYLMLYQISKIGAAGFPWEHTEIHLATSTDGYEWKTNSTNIQDGGTSCVVEAPDGTLYIYFVNKANKDTP